MQEEMILKQIKKIYAKLDDALNGVAQGFYHKVELVNDELGDLMDKLESENESEPEDKDE